MQRGGVRAPRAHQRAPGRPRGPSCHRLRRVSAPSRLPNVALLQTGDREHLVFAPAGIACEHSVVSLSAPAAELRR